MYSAKEVDNYWGLDGSVRSLSNINPDEIEDKHLASLWEKARQTFGTFEMYENLISEYLERPIS